MTNKLDFEYPENSELGKKSEYDPFYNPDKLFPIPRKIKRDEIGVNSEALPFHGFDCWNHYEVSWLNQKGKPVVATARIIYSSDSPNIIESKSMKLYFNSFNNTKFENHIVVQETVKKDLESKVGTEVDVEIIPLRNVDEKVCSSFEGILLDDLDIECTIYNVDPTFLTNENEIIVEESLSSDLLKSNCLVTNQPDWGSVQIKYKGQKISREGLLKYLVSFRDHNEFHEQCIERIFIDIMNRCNPSELTVHGKYTRRGGLDINPFRSTRKMQKLDFTRLCRQ